MPGPMDAYQYTAQAQRCRRLAADADVETGKRLIILAEDYERLAIELDEGSKAGLPPQTPEPGE